jgi:hypothetical protein
LEGEKMSFLLLKRKNYFRLENLRQGETISRRQYKSLYEEISIHFSLYSTVKDGKRFCVIRRESVSGTREFNGKTYDCPVPTLNHEQFSFYVEGTDFL